MTLTAEVAVPQTSEWMDFAACRGMDPDTFHPVHVSGEQGQRAEAQAKVVC